MMEMEKDENMIHVSSSIVPLYEGLASPPFFVSKIAICPNVKGSRAVHR